MHELGSSRLGTRVGIQGGYTRVGNRVGNTPYPAIPRAEVPTAGQRPQGAGPALQGQGGPDAGGDRPLRVTRYPGRPLTTPAGPGRYSPPQGGGSLSAPRAAAEGEIPCLSL